MSMRAYLVSIPILRGLIWLQKGLLSEAEELEIKAIIALFFEMEPEVKRKYLEESKVKK